MAHGLDVSNYQGHVDWAAVAASGRRYVWTLVTDGLGQPNRQYAAEDTAGALAHGMAAGHYHFARLNLHSADAEAQAFMAACPPGATFPPALDAERNWLPSRQANTDWVLHWFDLVNSSVRVLYTNGDGATAHLDSDRLVAAGVELWYAHPGAATLAGIGAWPTCSALQYGIGPVPGAGDVDLDLMPDTVFDRWIGGTPQPPKENDDMLVMVYPADYKDANGNAIRPHPHAGETWVVNGILANHVSSPHMVDVYKFLGVGGPTEIEAEWFDNLTLLPNTDDPRPGSLPVSGPVTVNGAPVDQASVEAAVLDALGKHPLVPKV